MKYFDVLMKQDGVSYSITLKLSRDKGTSTLRPLCAILFFSREVIMAENLILSPHRQVATTLTNEPSVEHRSRRSIAIEAQALKHLKQFFVPEKMLSFLHYSARAAKRKLL